MSTHKLANILVSASLLFVTGCQTITPMADQTPTDTAKIIPTASSTITPPSLDVTPTKVLTLTATPEKAVLPLDSTIENQCPEITAQFIPGDSTKGILIFSGRVGQNILFNLQTGEKKSLGGGSGPIVSPDRDHLAYLGLDENDFHRFLVVQTSGDPNQIELPLFDVTSYLSGWHDNQHLLYRMHSDITTDPAPHSITLFNPFTGEKKVYVPDFPNVDNDVEWAGSGPAAYDQTMDYVVYGGLKDTAKKTYEYVLWNKTSQTRIAVLPGSSYNGSYLYAGEILQKDGVSNNPPRWSPDDSRVAMISPALENQTVDEIFAVTKSGDVQRLTYFARHFKKAIIGKMDWSPDGRNIAFWVTLEPAPYELPQGTYQDVRLAILNTQTLEITYSCLSGDNIGLENGLSSAKFLRSDIPAPIWSPDGQQIIIENRYTIDGSRLILLDIPSSTATELGKDMEPIGWMLGK